jgi:hypothetical protein
MIHGNVKVQGTGRLGVLGVTVGCFECIPAAFLFFLVGQRWEGAEARQWDLISDSKIELRYNQSFKLLASYVCGWLLGTT